MWYTFMAYLKFLLSSTNQHGVHSPFVYDLVTQCFYDKTVYKAYSELKQYRKQFLQNKTFISITDLGPGSKTQLSKQRQVSEIVKTSGSTLKRSQLLYRLSQYLKPETILELGSSIGIATQALALGNPDSKIISIEGCPNLSAFTKHQLQSHQNVKLLTGDFNSHLQDFNKHSFDLIFFDGNHTKSATLDYFETLLHTAHNNTVFIFDDIYWSKGMTEAWEIIKQHQKVTVTIDSFFWGFVFFRKEQAKEHFKIRV